MVVDVVLIFVAIYIHDMQRLYALRFRQRKLCNSTNWIFKSTTSPHLDWHFSILDAQQISPTKSSDLQRNPVRRCAWPCFKKTHLHCRIQNLIGTSRWLQILIQHPTNVERCEGPHPILARSWKLGFLVRIFAFFWGGGERLIRFILHIYYIGHIQVDI